MRCVVHIDLDCFYAQVEAQRVGVDCEREPFLLLQWGMPLAVSYPARAFGIVRAGHVAEAIALCPNVKYAHVATYKLGETVPRYHPDPSRATHKVSLLPYRNASRRIFSLFKSFRGVDVEKGGVDEAFLDVTVAANEAIVLLSSQFDEVCARPFAAFVEALAAEHSRLQQQHQKKDKECRRRTKQKKGQRGYSLDSASSSSSSNSIAVSFASPIIPPSSSSSSSSSLPTCRRDVSLSLSELGRHLWSPPPPLAPMPLPEVLPPQPGALPTPFICNVTPPNQQQQTISANEGCPLSRVPSNVEPDLQSPPTSLFCDAVPFSQTIDFAALLAERLSHYALTTAKGKGEGKGVASVGGDASRRRADDNNNSSTNKRTGVAAASSSSAPLNVFPRPQQQQQQQHVAIDDGAVPNATTVINDDDDNNNNSSITNTYFCVEGLGSRCGGGDVNECAADGDDDAVIIDDDLPTSGDAEEKRNNGGAVSVAAVCDKNSSDIDEDDDGGECASAEVAASAPSPSRLPQPSSFHGHKCPQSGAADPLTPPQRIAASSAATSDDNTRGENPLRGILGSPFLTPEALDDAAVAVFLEARETAIEAYFTALNTSLKYTNVYSAPPDAADVGIAGVESSGGSVTVGRGTKARKKTASEGVDGADEEDALSNVRGAKDADTDCPPLPLPPVMPPVGVAAFAAHYTALSRDRSARCRLSAAAVVTKIIRDEVRRRLGYNCSAGVSTNKEVSKCISAIHKPNQQTLLAPKDTLGYLASLPFQRLRGLGGKLGRAVLAAVLGTYQAFIMQYQYDHRHDHRLLGGEEEEELGEGDDEGDDGESEEGGCSDGYYSNGSGGGGVSGETSRSIGFGAADDDEDGLSYAVPRLRPKRRKQQQTKRRRAAAAALRAAVLAQHQSLLASIAEISSRKRPRGSGWGAESSSSSDGGGHESDGDGDGNGNGGTGGMGGAGGGAFPPFSGGGGGFGGRGGRGGGGGGGRGGGGGGGAFAVSDYTTVVIPKASAASAVSSSSFASASLHTTHPRNRRTLIAFGAPAAPPSPAANSKIVGEHTDLKVAAEGAAGMGLNAVVALPSSIVGIVGGAVASTAFASKNDISPSRTPTRIAVAAPLLQSNDDDNADTTEAPAKQNDGVGDTAEGGIAKGPQSENTQMMAQAANRPKAAPPFLLTCGAAWALSEAALLSSFSSASSSKASPRHAASSDHLTRTARYVYRLLRGEGSAAITRRTAAKSLMSQKVLTSAEDLGPVAVLVSAPPPFPAAADVTHSSSASSSSYFSTERCAARLRRWVECLSAELIERYEELLEDSGRALRAKTIKFAFTVREEQEGGRSASYDVVNKQVPAPSHGPLTAEAMADCGMALLDPFFRAAVEAANAAATAGPRGGGGGGGGGSSTTPRPSTHHHRPITCITISISHFVTADGRSDGGLSGVGGAGRNILSFFQHRKATEGGGTGGGHSGSDSDEAVRFTGFVRGAPRPKPTAVELTTDSDNDGESAGGPHVSPVAAASSSATVAKSTAGGGDGAPSGRARRGAVVADKSVRKGGTSAAADKQSPQKEKATPIIALFAAAAARQSAAAVTVAGGGRSAAENLSARADGECPGRKATAGGRATDVSSSISHTKRRGGAVDRSLCVGQRHSHAEEEEVHALEEVDDGEVLAEEDFERYQARSFAKHAVVRRAEPAADRRGRLARSVEDVDVDDADRTHKYSNTAAVVVPCSDSDSCEGSEGGDRSETTIGDCDEATTVVHKGRLDMPTGGRRRGGFSAGNATPPPPQKGHSKNCPSHGLLAEGGGRETHSCGSNSNSNSMLVVVDCTAVVGSVASTLRVGSSSSVAHLPPPLHIICTQQPDTQQSAADVPCTNMDVDVLGEARISSVSSDGFF